MYFEFLLRRAHSRRRVERRYWSGVSLNSFTACSNEVTTGITGPIGSGLPQFGLPRLLAILTLFLPFQMYEGALTNDFQLLDSPRPVLVSAAEAKFQGSTRPRKVNSPLVKTTYYKATFQPTQHSKPGFLGYFA